MLLFESLKLCLISGIFICQFEKHLLVGWANFFPESVVTEIVKLSLLFEDVLLVKVPKRLDVEVHILLSLAICL